MYVIILSVTSLLLYTLVIAVGYYKSHKRPEEINPVAAVKRVVSELKINLQEDVKLDKGNYKNTRSSEMGKPIEGGYEGFTNKLSLTDLIKTEPTDDNYDEVIDLLTELAQKTYKDYKFFIARSQNEVDEPHFVQIVSHPSEQPTLHKKIFSRSMNYNLDMKELQARFADHVAQNKVIDLGEGVVVITDDGTNQLPTGVSPINNGLEGAEIAFIITFVSEENFKGWFNNTFGETE